MGGKITGGKEFLLSDASAIAEEVSGDLQRHGIENVIVGSIRRKKPMVHDIDIVVRWDDKAERYCRERFGELKNGNPKRNGLVNGINVEIYPGNDDCWISSICTWTGSVQENIRLRSKAKKMGITLSQNGIKRGEELIVPGTEQEFYELLGEQYVEPENR